MTVLELHNVQRSFSETTLDHARLLLPAQILLKLIRLQLVNSFFVLSHSIYSAVCANTMPESIRTVHDTELKN